MQEASFSWGLTLDHTLLVLALILVLLDFFFAPDTLTHVSYVLVSVVIARQFDVHIMYQVVIGICSWGAIITFHFLVWRTLIQKIVNTYISPDKFLEGARGLVGEEGRIVDIEGKKMIRVKGDLWKCSNIDQFDDGATIKIVSQTDGILTAESVERSQ